MNKYILPDIIFRKEFADFSENPFTRMVNYAKNGLKEYKKEYNSNTLSNILKYKEFIEISRLLKESGFREFVPIKGMYLLNTLFYDYSGLRPMSDIDFLFSPNEYKKIALFLKNHPELEPAKGKHSFSEHGFEAYVVKFHNVIIEFHSRITTLPIAGLIDSFFKNTEETETCDGIKITVPKVEYALIAMLMHDYTASSLSNFSVRRLLEFYIVLSCADFDLLKKITSEFCLDRVLDMQLFMIWTMLEKTFFPRDSFKIYKEFCLIEKKNGMFHVKHPWKIHRKIFHGKTLPLGIKNYFASIFRKQ